MRKLLKNNTWRKTKHAYPKPVKQNILSRYLRRITYDDKAAVYKAESARSSDARAAVDNWWAVSGIQHPWLANSLQELKECGGRAGDPKIGPGGIVELHDVAAVTAFKIVESD